MFLGIDKFNPQNIAAIDDCGSRVTYGELCQYAVNFSSILPKRSIVFMLCTNNTGALISYISMVENDIIPVLLNDNINNELLNQLIQTYMPQYICKESSKVDRSAEKVTIEIAGFAYIKTEFKAYDVHDDLELLMTTSGSTGSPKLVRYKKGNLEANAKNVAKAWNWTSSERPICDLHMNYTMGLNVINTHLYVGATLLLVSCNITEAKYWSFIKKEKATNITGVPFSYDLLWKLRFYRMNLPYLTTLSEGGGKLTEDMFKTLAEFANKNNKRFIASYGTTETSARMSILYSEFSLKKIGSIGKAIPEGELFLVDNNGKIINEMVAEGELVYKGPNVTMGYATKADDLTLGDIFQGIYYTGDIAKRDSDGFYYIIGRKSRFLKLLGHRVSLDDCENMIREHFNIDCACTGNDSAMYIYVENYYECNKVSEFLNTRTGLHSSLFQVRNIDSIPRNNFGKIIYHNLFSR